MVKREIALAEGACVTCLAEGSVRYPLDFSYHHLTNGHLPMFTEAGRKVLEANGFMVRHQGPFLVQGG